jgi:3-hydroxyacyl-CoA dehydrogenase
MGPFTLLDFVGIETTYYIAEILFNEYREKCFAPSPLMKSMIMAGDSNCRDTSSSRRVRLRKMTGG